MPTPLWPFSRTMRGPHGEGEVFFNKQQWRAAISQAEAALADDPNNADADANASFWNMFLGHSEDGFAGVETALRLSPRDPTCLWQFYMCHLHTHLAQWEQAIEWCGKSVAGGPRVLVSAGRPRRRQRMGRP